MASNTVNEGGAGLFVAALVAHQDAIAADVNALIAAAPGLRIVGFSIRESAGAPAAAKTIIKHGATAAGGTDVIYSVLAASGGFNQWFGDAGIAVPNGISITAGSGTVDLAVYYKIVV